MWPRRCDWERGEDDGVEKERDRQECLSHSDVAESKEGHGMLCPYEDYQCARMRYFNTDVPFFSIGTLNWAAKAAVLVNL